MDALTLARLQFAVTTVYHFFFVPLTLGLSILVAIMETLYVQSGQDVYKQMTKFWGKLFIINFAMGVVTGIVQEFQFGMNWSEYSRYVGDIFGAPLAIEALLAFFLESTFLGVWIFGWDKLSKKVHATAIWLVAISSNLSALWILIANSFMQQPVGYEIINGRAQMNDFFALILNPNIWTQFPHVVSSGLSTAAFFILGISAFHLLRAASNHDMHRRSFQIAAIIGTLAVIGVIMTGHSQAQHMVETQPMKMAAAEALWDTESPAAMSLFTVGNEKERRDVFAIRIPRLLSLLAYNQLNGTVKGINELQEEFTAQYGPGNYVPPVAVSYWSFRLMVGAGMLMLLAAIYALFLTMGEEVGSKSPRLLKFFPYLIALPYLANTTGWLLTELGRAPWVVYGLMKMEDAVSINVGIGALWTTLIGFTLLYGVLMVADLYLLVKYARKNSSKPLSQKSGEAAISLAGD
ncbi:MAG: cytochrome ubiquinol oxidase subunit I [Anaerolineales bacterium]|nr:cytochrome ubiquinol oxidase subunit I [Anaerolineales bacterium]MCB8967852.1 cytochrome ubiquinol oxidase subunit I [Ardenticatenaceae bacterium]